MAPLDISALAFAVAPAVNSKGAKTLPALHKDGSSVSWQWEDLLGVVFEPSAYNDVTTLPFESPCASLPQTRYARR